MGERNDFRITRLENEVDFFKKTTEQSMIENGKKIDRILNVLESDETLNRDGLVEKVNKLESKLYSLKNFLNAYKLAVAMIGGLFAAIGSGITYYINYMKG